MKWCFAMHQRHWSCCFTVPAEVFDAITFGRSIFSHLLLFWQRWCKSVKPRLLQQLFQILGRDCGGLAFLVLCFLWCLQALGSFVHISLPLQVSSGEIGSVSPASLLKRCSHSVYEAMHAEQHWKKSSPAMLIMSNCAQGKKKKKLHLQYYTRVMQFKAFQSSNKCTCLLNPL